jgi:hypothetical protein
LKQRQKILPITSPMATVGIGICLKLIGGGDVIALSSARRIF